MRERERQQKVEEEERVGCFALKSFRPRPPCFFLLLKEKEFNARAFRLLALSPLRRVLPFFSTTLVSNLFPCRVTGWRSQKGHGQGSEKAPQMAKTVSLDAERETRKPLLVLAFFCVFLPSSPARSAAPKRSTRAIAAPERSTTEICSAPNQQGRRVERARRRELRRANPGTRPQLSSGMAASLARSTSLPKQGKKNKKRHQLCYSPCTRSRGSSPCS